MEGVAQGMLTDGSGILTVNTGSSSIKVTLYRVEGASEVPELSAVAERIGVRGGRVRLSTAGGESRG
jgi:acetate kinase